MRIEPSTFSTSTSTSNSTSALTSTSTLTSTMYNSFRDMPVWQHSLDLSSEVFTISQDLPKSEDYGLTSQIRRSANSVTASIAEAFGRKTKKDKSHFYIISRGSAYETQSHILYGIKVGYFNETNVDKLLTNYNELIHELNKILKTLG